MGRLSESQRESLKSAVSKYHAALPGSPAEEYLSQRGLSLSDVEKYRIGYVEDPLVEHTQYTGKMVIPYLRWHPRFGWSAVTMRFRALDGSKPKYQSIKGDHPRIFNTQALMAGGLEVGVAEGEIDAITATKCGMPTVGVPGTTSWQDHWTPLFEGYKTVHLFVDGDDAGEKFASEMMQRLPNVRLVPFPPGEDVNSLYCAEGEEQLQQLWER